MSKLKIFFAVALMSILVFGIFQLTASKYRNFEIISINDEISSLDLSISLNKKLKQLEYTSKDAIERILIFDKRGNIIRKENSINGLIPIKDIKEKEFSISFLSKDKFTLKSINY